MKKNRLNVYLKPATLEEIKELADKLSMTQTGVAAMAIQAGLDTVRMSINPDFKKYFLEMIKTGKPVQLPDGSIMGSEENEPGV